MGQSWAVLHSSKEDPKIKGPIERGPPLLLLLLLLMPPFVSILTFPDEIIKKKFPKDSQKLKIKCHVLIGTKISKVPNTLPAHNQITDFVI